MSFLGKKKMIKLGFIGLLAGMATYLLLPVLAQTPTAEIYLTPATKTVNQNEIVSMAVRIKTNGNAVNVVTVDVVYPTDQLEMQSIYYLETAFEILVEETGGPGVIRISRATNPAKNGDYLIAGIDFKVKPSSGNISVSVGDQSEAYSPSQDGSNSVNVLSTRSGSALTLAPAAQSTPTPPPPATSQATSSSGHSRHSPAPPSSGGSSSPAASNSGPQPEGSEPQPTTPQDVQSEETESVPIIDESSNVAAANKTLVTQTGFKIATAVVVMTVVVAIGAGLALRRHRLQVELDRHFLKQPTGPLTVASSPSGQDIPPTIIQPTIIQPTEPPAETLNGPKEEL